LPDYILELCPNGSLLSELQKVEHFSEERARFYLAEMINALEHMHSKGVVHRDLKPDNVLLGPTMHAKLTDFGTSKEIGNETRARSDSFCGTEEYVSPELLDEETPYASKRYINYN
jgi:serine/threonine protein kinase